MFKVFIKNPVLSTVISILIVILGIIGIISLPVAQYPEIAPPTVQVSTTYQGASAEVVMNSVIVPLEEQINGVENMSYMTSTASSDGTATIQIYFKLGTDPDMATVNVQNRVSQTSSLLPAAVTTAGVTTQKQQSSNVLIFGLYSDNPNYDATFIQNYANINIIPQVKRVSGVGSASAFGTLDYSMRIWLKPDVMASYGIIPDDINTALAEQNIEAAPGSLGERGKQSFQYTLKYKGRLTSEKEFSDIIVKETSDGQILRLKDVARIELGSQTYNSLQKINGHPAIGVAVTQTAGSNAQEVIDQSLKVLEDATPNLPKGLHFTTMVNINKFLDASIEKVIHTLIEAFILVFIVVFIFLQDWRSTLIPAISVPVAIVGTFFFLNLFGFTINLLTLFALVLAVGIVVDDAIVVVEAVHAKMDKGEKSALNASLNAMNEISGAIISITLVMAAVFVPVSFISGSTGVFYKQFGLTLAIAIILSAINALTLSPALCAIFLKPHEEGEHKKKGFLQRFYDSFNTAFDATTAKYKKSVSFFAKKKVLTLGVIVVFGGLLFYLMKSTPSSFVPDEDMGTIMCDISLPADASMERTNVVATEVEKLAKTLPGINNTMRIVGQGMLSGKGSNYAMVIIELKDWKLRSAKGQDVNSLIGQLFGKVTTIKNAKVIFFPSPTINGFGVSGGFSFQLQDKTGGDIQKFNTIAQKFLAALNQRKEIQYASTSFNPSFPQYEVEIDVAKVKKAGFTVNNVLDAMEGYYGGVYASNFNSYGKLFRVTYQADADYRADINSLNLIKIRNTNDSLAPISAFVTLKKIYGPQSLNRFNMYTAVSVNGSPNSDYSSGDAIKAIKEVAAETLPSGYGYEFSGLTREEVNSGTQTVYIFILCIIFVYFLLSAQYESYILPFAVLLPLTIGLSGAFIFAKIFDISNNIYLQITLIMLIGLLAKNAILIVEYALDRRRLGMPIVQAAIEGASARFRPILMTSFAFILGLMPLMLSTGAGANGNKSIGTGAIGGMLIGTVIGIFVIPALFIMFQSLQEKVSKKKIVENVDVSNSIAALPE
ncbi:efflux RND transporter permease subunit [Rhizosphaericola mali]|uniref:Efflux RND transporter permease subunit n=1 Tax=Rhizosphaericola mali TaxID=2545455 RepID=A0A5P2G2K8_9BACT|nr:efflux RND transporter permease subunit [Rhizosphaericola mali]QES88948.1 efflux RND transporter permease subunit [Rhizosphaericola mali]